ncbi:hypothetical protein [Streptomyces sp. NPDC057052]|uniref:hypothetical protein n=1 Tax=Streptomyces sp. NPDC057052 TaxID=3346010 RepID=UPI00363C7208
MRTGEHPAEGTVPAGAARLPSEVLAARGRVHLYSRTHIDLRRVADALLCRP